MKTTYNPIRQKDGIIVDQILSGGNMLVGGKFQDIHTPSTTKNYDIGTRLVEGDRVFRYCRAGANLSRFIGGFNENQWPINAALTVAAILNATTMSVPDASCAVNAYAGGYIAIFTSPLQFYRILSNTVSDGANTVLTLETPLRVGAAIGVWVTGYPSPYADLRNITSGATGYNSVMAVPVCDVPSGSYFWGQTWGPCYAVADGTVPGITKDKREVFWAESGNIEPYTDSGAGNGQLAGFLIPRTESGSGDQFYMLTLSP